MRCDDEVCALVGQTRYGRGAASPCGNDSHGGHCYGGNPSFMSVGEVSNLYSTGSTPRVHPGHPAQIQLLSTDSKDRWVEWNAWMVSVCDKGVVTTDIPFLRGDCAMRWTNEIEQTNQSVCSGSATTPPHLFEQVHATYWSFNTQLATIGEDIKYKPF